MCSCIFEQLLRSVTRSIIRRFYAKSGKFSQVLRINISDNIESLNGGMRAMSMRTNIACVGVFITFVGSHFRLLFSLNRAAPKKIVRVESFVQHPPAIHWGLPT